MDCWPELSVSKRKPLSVSKVAKRLRRFVADNQRPDAPLGQVEDDDAAGAGESELVCRVPDETLFQLQQIYEALETRTESILSKPKKSRRKSFAGVMGVGDGINYPFSSAETSVSGEAAASLAPMPKTPSKKRSRGSDEPATELVSRHGGIEDGSETERKNRRKKKERRKSSAL